jgi:hypothetical protein
MSLALVVLLGAALVLDLAEAGYRRGYGHGGGGHGHGGGKGS